ncbi:MAG: hypothetical protein ACYC8V_13510 [Caulobacteraceae bacterium]
MRQLDAYKEGRRDERRNVGDVAEDERITKKDLADAYDRGRREERLRRRRSPFGTLLMGLLAIVGVIAIVLPIRYGSFTAAGAAVDGVFISTAQRATAPVHGAVDKAGNALENAGTNLKQKAGTGGP